MIENVTHGSRLTVEFSLPIGIRMKKIPIITTTQRAMLKMRSNIRLPL
jgi:hypothetical protein